MNKSDNSLETIATGSRFLSTTVHEMRTPIQTIISALELLQTTALDKEQLEYIHQMQIGADTLLSLANNILDFSKIRSEGFTLEKIDFDLFEIVERVMDSVSAEVFAKGLELISDFYTSVPRFITGDPVRLQQILLNIVKNAVKFTEKGHIQTIVERPDENTLLFKIEDTGIGIPLEARKKLFSDFYQADTSTTRRYGGTGLGLSICRALVQVMHGKIGVEENPQGGSVFWFTIPCVESKNKNLPSLQIAPHLIPANTRILLVDDNFLARKTFDHKLKNLGFHSISLSANGEDALQKMKEAAQESKPFTIVFIDMVMPKMDGWRLANEINSNRLINSAKLYLTVSEGQMRTDAKMKMLNWFNGYLYKPVKIKKLKSLMQTALSVPIELNTDVSEFTKQTKEKIKNQEIFVLVAEDHPVNKKLLAAFLKKMGATVLEADDGSQALKIARQNPGLDIVFLDVQMPVMSGLDASKKMRESGYSGVIVACTANHSKTDTELYKKAGMNDVLGKPYKIQDLQKMISKWKSVFPSEFRQNDVQRNAVNRDPDLVWDIPDFEDTVGGKLSFGAHLLSDFIEQTETLIEQIPFLEKENNFTKLRQVGHTLKGSAATISANKIAAHGDKLNRAAHEKSSENILKEYSSLLNSLDKFKKAVSKWKKEHGLENKLSYTHDFL